MIRSLAPPTLPSSLTFTCRADGKEQAGLLASLSLLMGHKNHYHLVIGPSSDFGEIVISNGEINKEVEEASRLCPMDYAGLADFTGEIAVRPMDCPQIEAAIRAYDLYHAVSPYRAGYRDQLVQAWEKLFRMAPKRLDVETQTVPGIHILAGSVVPSPPFHHP